MDSSHRTFLQERETSQVKGRKGSEIPI